MVINKVEIAPGTSEVVKLLVGRLPSDTRLYLQVHVWRSRQPGPVVGLVAGVHGDEINSVEILRRLIASGMLRDLRRGSVIVIPVLNVYGFNSFSREMPDGKDVNRSFPGSLKGSLASRVAAMFTRHILPLLDFGVDFHTGGNSNYNFPQIRFSKDHVPSLELARQFAAPYLIANKPLARSLRKTALKAGKPVIVFEGGENLRYDGLSIQVALTGIQRLLHAHDMLAEAPPAATEPIHLANSHWVRASRPGMFRWFKSSGQPVAKGEPLGVICDPYGTNEWPVLASHTGHLIGHNNATIVNIGEALFHIGFSNQ
ncbi:MAG: succinylglutamate desuccinylase [Saprospiraceae bacterium]|nr:MAG: succinylglutamate desuccinylase [Saprospiraceae bacterium]